MNVDTPATDKPAPTIRLLISCVPPRGTVPTRLPPIEILPPSIKSPSDILTVPINPAACPEADDVAPTPKNSPTNRYCPIVLTPDP